MLEVSCRTMFMRCADAAIVSVPVEEWEPSMGEPPAVLTRRSADDLVEAFEQDLADVQVLKLLEPEWLDSMNGASRVQSVISAFAARGGVVERG